MTDDKGARPKRHADWLRSIATIDTLAVFATRLRAAASAIDEMERQRDGARRDLADAALKWIWQPIETAPQEIWVIGWWSMTDVRSCKLTDFDGEAAYAYWIGGDLKPVVVPQYWQPMRPVPAEIVAWS